MLSVQARTAGGLNYSELTLITPSGFDVLSRAFSQTFAIKHFSAKLEIFAYLHNKELADIASPFH